MKTGKHAPIFILGFMGAGKSTIGKLLAHKLNYNYVDTDDLIERLTDTNISKLFDTYGEPHFRSIESGVLGKLAILNNTLISCGGGLPCFQQKIDLLNSIGKTVYLEVAPSIIVSRLMEERGDRPLIKALKEEELMSYVSLKLKERKKFYEQAQIIISNLDQSHTIEVLTNWLLTP